jgi:hypothetical protein
MARHVTTERRCAGAIVPMRTASRTVMAYAEKVFWRRRRT